MWTDVFPGNMLLFFFQPFRRCANCFAMDKSFHAQISVFPRPRILMKRFLSSRSSSQQELQPLDDVRAERAAIALSVGLSWPPDRYTKTPRGRPNWQQLWERALQDHIMNHHELPLGIRLQRPVWWRPGEAIDRPLTHEELAHVKTPRAATVAPAIPAAALVEDEPSGSGSKRRKVQVDPIARDWFLDMLGQWRRERRWDMQRCLCEVQRLCPGMFDGINPNTPYRWKRSTARAETRGRRRMLSPADTTRHIMKVTDVLCLSAVTIHFLVHEWLDAEGLDVRPCYSWVTSLLRGMRLSFKKPAKCLKELSPEQQHANTHRLFIKLCWLMDKHAVSADRVVNIDEISCRLLRASDRVRHRDVKQAQLQGNTREATTFTIAFSKGRGPLDMLVQIVHAVRTDAVLPEQPWPERTHHVTSENGWATTTTLLQLTATLDRQGGTSVDPSLGHGQHPRQRGHLGRRAGRIPSHRVVLHPAAQHVVLAALRRGRLPQLQELHPDAGERHACPRRPRWLLQMPGHHGGASLRPNGHLVQPRTCARRTRRGQLDGIACAQAATPSSAMP